MPILFEMFVHRTLLVLFQALQRTCTNLRNERSQAHDAEHQALVRAAAFESDRDKIQRQFKVPVL